MTEPTPRRQIHAHHLPGLIAEVLGDLVRCDVVPEVRWSARDRKLEVRVGSLPDALVIVGTHVEVPASGTIQALLTKDEDLVWTGPLKSWDAYGITLRVGWRLVGNLGGTFPSARIGRLL